MASAVQTLCTIAPVVHIEVLKTGTDNIPTEIGDIPLHNRHAKNEIPSNTGAGEALQNGVMFPVTQKVGGSNPLNHPLY